MLIRFTTTGSAAALARHDEERKMTMAVTGILGKKIGITQLFDDRGDVHPVTVLKAGPCVITQLKTQAKDGYDAAQIGYVDFIKASKMNKAMTGHFAKSNVPPVRMMKEVPVRSEEHTS